jgi:Na+-driven multidrug efflux pump
LSTHPAVPTRREETATIIGISLPLTAAYIAEMVMVITDMIIVGRLGSNELAAVGLAVSASSPRRVSAPKIKKV